MSSNEIKKKTEPSDIVLRDLQTLLRKNLNEQVIVVDFKTSELLPKGENYSSTMLKVEAVIKKNSESPEEKLSLVAKMIPYSDFQKTHLNIKNSFAKEIYVFEKLIPIYKELEREAGIKDEDTIDILPKYYGGRLSRKDELLEEADEDVVLLMENLKTRNFCTMNRFQGMDLYHAKEAISRLARFHALGRALKYKKPELYDEVLKNMSACPFVMEESEFKEISKYLLNLICEDPRIATFKDRLAVLSTQTWNFLYPSNVSEPWISLIHGDFWVNNIMFQDENGKIKDVKFVDFQLAKQSNPLGDLPYFICGSVKADVITNHFNEILNVYYEKFLNTLKSLNCDVSPFTRTSFEENLKAEGDYELFHCLLALKFFTLEASDDLDFHDLQKLIVTSKATQLFFDRAFAIISKFAENNWI